MGPRGVEPRNARFLCFITISHEPISRMVECQGNVSFLAL